MRMTGIESKLMKAVEDIHCSNCFYFKMAKTSSEVTPEVPYCHRRERQIGWNPLLFMCGDFGSKDETIAFQSKLDWKWRYAVKTFDVS